LGAFLTPDQRGGLWLYLDNPKRAATNFDTPIYRAWAYYLAGDFRMAAQAAQRDRSDRARFLEANAWAHGKSYGQALRIYDEILAANPDHREAAHNRQQVWNLVVAAAEQGESQLPDTGELVRLESDVSDDAVTTQSDEAAILMTLEADRLLSDPEALRRWRAQV
jgi:Ca-activated chloride channel family protein